jgi:hypothetical protein
MPQLELGSSWHAPELQIWPDEHDWHGWPPLPHALADWPERHWLPMQQPLQLPGPHCEALTQVAWLQVSPALQALQVSPPWPQSVTSVPGLHAAPEQQPLQLVALQLWETHSLSTHAVPGPHSWHGCPPLPQASSTSPERQIPPSQQPLQSSALQPQLWSSHFWLAAHATQGCPPLPQESF